jgi:hypothetical protein
MAAGADLWPAAHAALHAIAAELREGHFFVAQGASLGTRTSLPKAMKRLRKLRRWFGRKFGYVSGAPDLFSVLCIVDRAPVEELRVRIFDTFQVVDSVKTAKPVVFFLSMAESGIPMLSPNSTSRFADRSRHARR